MNKNKMLNLIGTGTATGALVIMAILFSNGRFGNLAGTTSAAEADPAPIIAPGAADLESQNAELKDALTLMQAREAEYQTKLEEANDMLLNPPQAAYDEGETYEYEDYEDDEYEEEEEHEEESEDEADEEEDYGDAEEGDAHDDTEEDHNDEMEESDDEEDDENEVDEEEMEDEEDDENEIDDDDEMNEEEDEDDD